jgi:hypothetical protein
MIALQREIVTHQSAKCSVPDSTIAVGKRSVNDSGNCKSSGVLENFYNAPRFEVYWFCDRSSVNLTPASGGNSATISRNLSHPYYWAPFILIATACKTELSHRENELSHRLNESTHRLNELSHRENELSHRLNESTRRENESTRRLDELSHRENELTHRLNELTHRLNELTP